MKRREFFKMNGVLAAAPTVAFAATPIPEHDTLLSDLLIPDTDARGAKSANVDRYINLFPSVTPADRAEHLIGRLRWLDGYASQTYGSAFTGCSKRARIAIEKGHQFFQMIKGITTRFYDNTPIGLRELNEGACVPSTFGCAHGGHA
jgi:hypothetical protein